MKKMYLVYLKPLVLNIFVILPIKIHLEAFSTLEISVIFVLSIKNDGRNKIKSLTMGMGFNWRDISLDYAFLNEPRSSGLGSTHLISLSINSDLILEYLDKI